MNKKLLKGLIMTNIIAMVVTIFSLQTVYASEGAGYNYEDEIIIMKDMETGEEAYNIMESNVSRSNFKQTKTEGYNPNSKKLQTREIINNSDERERVTNPYTAIAFLEATFSDGTVERGTAFLIHKKLALTAGHCVYKAEKGGFATRVRIYPAKNGSIDNPYGYSTSTRTHISQGYVNSEKDKYDWAMIELDSEIGNTCGWLGIAYSDDYSYLVNTNVTVTGYPYNDNVIWTQYQGSGRVKKVDDYSIYYETDTSVGQSGSPMWDDPNYTVGIHAGYYPLYNANRACLIRKSMFEHFVSYMN